MRKRFDTPEAESLSESDQTGPPGHTSSVRPVSCAYCGRVLVVDDCAEARSITAALLRLRGFDVLEAQDGEEGIALYGVLRGAIDVVLLDMQMPGLDGIATFRELKRMHPSVKAVMYSGALTSAQADEAIDAGVVGCLAKPTDADVIHRMLVHAIGADKPG